MKVYDVRIDGSIYLTIEAEDEKDVRNQYLALLKDKYKLMDYDISNVIIKENNNAN